MIQTNSNKNKGFARIAWLFGIIGGVCFGFGGGIIVIVRMTIDRLLSLGSGISVNAMAYGDVQILGAILIMIGIVGVITGLYFIGRIREQTSGFPPPP